MRRALKSVLVLAIVCWLSSCDSYVEKTTYDAEEKKVSDLTHQLNDANEKLNKVQQALSECQAHKYQIFHDGLRTWRFDGVRGTSCILLTTKEDWKSKDTKSESCDCQDLYGEDGKLPDEAVRKLYCGF